MIYTRIRGGLGNQLFQYCTARVIADELGVNLGLDVREYEKTSIFKLGLSRFNLRAEYNPKKLIKHKKDGKIAYALDCILGNHRHVYEEQHLKFDNTVLSKPDGTYFKGYWQSEEYFKSNRIQILNDLEITKKPSKKNISTLNDIENCLAVSLHIRRGDYISNNSTHGTCDLAYYERAVGHLVNRLGKDIVIFAFSDDPGWVSKNLRLPVNIRYIKHNSSDKNYEDLRLMSHCKHNIIANSSFSWWGAWLNKNPKKLVIAPERWFSNAKVTNPDIIPIQWIRL